MKLGLYYRLIMSADDKAHKLTPEQIFSQNLSPFNPNVEIGIAPLQSVVEFEASKNVATSGQSALPKNKPSILFKVPKK